MFDELKKKIHLIRKDLEQLGKYLDIPTKEKRIDELEHKMNEPNFWLDQQEANKVIKELKTLKSSVQQYSNFNNKLGELEELLNISHEEKEDFFTEVDKELDLILKEIKNLESQILLGGQFDLNSAILSINAGAGGTESCDWVSMLMRMYLRWAERHNYKTKVVDILDGEEAGVKNVTIEIIGDYAYGYLKSENGVHRLVRISPFDANRRRHTSFASVEVIAKIEDDIVVEIKPEDLRIDTYRASGKGGQHVNMTDSAVRITHLPTGIVTQCQNERSQYQNKVVAMSVLRAKLYELKRREQEKEIAKEYAIKQKIEWGSQIRSYVMHPYNMVKDHRTEYQTGNVQAVMDGEIDDFIQAYLKWKAEEKK